VIPPGTRLPENLDEPRFRLLRIEVLLACDAPQEAINLANGWLETPDGQAFTPDDLDKLRLLVAEAHLQTGKFAPAADSLARISAAHADDPRAVALMERLGQAFRSTDAPQAVRWLQRALRATAEEDPAFRGRLVASWQARVQANPADRQAVLAEIDQRSALFESPDCPEPLREAIAVLRGTKNGG
jgi:hypothetical protein